jgi:hypothetical protein
MIPGQLPVGSGWHNRKARLITATLALCQNFAGQGEGLMKGGAPWEDRTSLARGGLTGTVVVGMGGAGASFGSLPVVGASSSVVGSAPVVRMAVALFHTMEYGKWLETVNGAGMGGRASASPDQLMDATWAGPLATIHPAAAKIGPALRTQVKRLWGRP